MLNRKAVKSRKRKISKLHVDVCIMESRIPLGPGKFHVVVLVLFLEQIAPSPAAHARTLLQGFSRMSRRGNGGRNSRNRLCFWPITEGVLLKAGPLRSGPRPTARDGPTARRPGGPAAQRPSGPRSTARNGPAARGPRPASARRPGGPGADFPFPLNKLTSVFYASVLLLIMNFVITLSK